MALWVKLFTVVGLGAVELWAAIPAGFALRLHPVVTGIAAGGGATLGAFVVILLGERLRARLWRRFGSHGAGVRQGRIRRIWARYGVAGLGLLAPLLTGAPLGAVLGLSLGAPASRLLFWMTLGVIIWTAGLTIVATLGLAGIQALRR